MAALEERVQRAIRILDGMPARDRLVFLLKVVDGLSYAAIAAKVGITVEKVERRMARAYQHCARFSEEEERLETPFTLIHILNRIRRHFLGGEPR